eukprot:4695480-Pleurochrysis_carterae.AAC.6
MHTVSGQRATAVRHQGSVYVPSQATHTALPTFHRDQQNSPKHGHLPLQSLIQEGHLATSVNLAKRPLHQ